MKYTKCCEKISFTPTNKAILNNNKPALWWVLSFPNSPFHDHSSLIIDHWSLPQILLLVTTRPPTGWTRDCIVWKKLHWKSSIHDSSVLEAPQSCCWWQTWSVLLRRNGWMDDWIDRLIWAWKWRIDFVPWNSVSDDKVKNDIADQDIVTLFSNIEVRFESSCIINVWVLLWLRLTHPTRCGFVVCVNSLS